MPGTWYLWRTPASAACTGIAGSNGTDRAARTRGEGSLRSISGDPCRRAPQVGAGRTNRERSRFDDGARESPPGDDQTNEDDRQETIGTMKALARSPLRRARLHSSHSQNLAALEHELGYEQRQRPRCPRRHRKLLLNRADAVRLEDREDNAKHDERERDSEALGTSLPAPRSAPCVGGHSMEHGTFLAFDLSYVVRGEVRRHADVAEIRTSRES